MLDLCWNCGDPNHHRRACQNDPIPGLKKIIQASFKRDQGLEKYNEKNMIQLQRWINNGKNRENDNPPLILFKAEVNRLDQFLYELEQEYRQLSEGRIPISADCLLAKVDLVTQHQSELKKELFNIQQVKQLKHAYRTADKILEQTIEIIHQSQKSLSNGFNELFLDLCAAIRVLDSFQANEQAVRKFVILAKGAYNEHSLNFNVVRKDWDENKDKVINMIASMKKYIYLFAEADQVMLNGRCEAIQALWAEVERDNEEFEDEMPETTCKVCYSAKIDHAIGCGHLFCGNCAARLRICPRCRAVVTSRLQVYF